MRCGLPPLYTIALKTVRVICCHPLFSQFLCNIPLVNKVDNRNDIKIALPGMVVEPKLTEAQTGFIDVMNIWQPKFPGIQHLILRGMLYQDTIEDTLRLLIEFWRLPCDKLIDWRPTKLLVNLTITLPWLYDSISSMPSYFDSSTDSINVEKYSFILNFNIFIDLRCVIIQIGESSASLLDF